MYVYRILRFYRSLNLTLPTYLSCLFNAILFLTDYSIFTASQDTFQFRFIKKVTAVCEKGGGVMRAQNG